MRTLALALALCAATSAHADGPFVGVRLVNTTFDYVESGNPWTVESDRVRPAMFAGYRSAGGFEIAVDHSWGDTGIAGCPPGPPCPAVAIPTRVALTGVTAGYAWPIADDWSLTARAGVELARAKFAHVGTTREESLLAAATLGYHLSSRVSVGLDVSASGFESRSVGLALRYDF